MSPSGTRACLPALLLSLAVAAGGGSAALAATLSVDDADATGVVGDDRLSLAEAIRLAGGVLPSNALSAAERMHVKGEPGAASADLVRVVLGKGAIVTSPAGAAIGLPALVGNEGDVFDGGGAILEPEGGPGAGIGMLTNSSRIEIRRFAFEGYRLGLVVAATPGLGDLEQIRIWDNRFSGYDSGLVVVPNSNGSKGLRGLSITGNEFTTENGRNDAIAVIAANPETPGAEAFDYEVSDVLIRDNEIRGGTEGIGVFGGLTKTGTTARDGRLHGVEIVGNRISDIFDLPIAVFAGFASGGGEASRIEVSDVLVAGNTIDTDGTPSIHIWVVAGTAVGEPGGLVQDNQLHDVAVLRNRTSGGGECPGGIQLQASQNELGAGTVRGNVLEHVAVLGNSVSACGTGLAVFGAVVAAGHGLVENNTLRDVQLARNRLSDNERGVLVSGAAALEGSAFPLPMPQPALAQHNVADAVEIVGNRIRGGNNGILAIGGISNFTSDAVVANSVTRSSESRNVVRDVSVRCNAIDDVLLGDVGGSAVDNVAEFACSP